METLMGTLYVTAYYNSIKIYLLLVNNYCNFNEKLCAENINNSELLQ